MRLDIGMMKRASTRTMPGIVAACGLLALAAVTLCWASQAQARSYEIGSRDAFMASLFDPFLLTATPLSASDASAAGPAPAPAAMPTAPASPAAAPYVPPIRIPYRPPLRSPSRPPML